MREDHLLPTIDSWLGHLFDETHLEETIGAMSNIDLNDSTSLEELDARRTIKDCDKRIANFEIACGASDDPETIAVFARRTEGVRSERKGAELRLRRATTRTRSATSCKAFLTQSLSWLVHHRKIAAACTKRPG
jgi:hypothetical protein